MVNTETYYSNGRGVCPFCESSAIGDTGYSVEENYLWLGRTVEHGQNSDLVEHCLAHVTGGKALQAYDREYPAKWLEEKRAVMQWYGDVLEHLASRNTSKSAQGIGCFV